MTIGHFLPSLYLLILTYAALCYQPCGHQVLSPQSVKFGAPDTLTMTNKGHCLGLTIEERPVMIGSELTWHTF